MVSGEDCSCTDSTVTSSNSNTKLLNSNDKLEEVTKTVDKGTNRRERENDINENYYYCIPSTILEQIHAGLPNTPVESNKDDHLLRENNTKLVTKDNKSSKTDKDQPKPPKYEEKLNKKEKKMTERIDIYYFDHGNSAYYRTTDFPPILSTDKCSEKTDSAATRFWAEIFGTIHIGIAFFTAFILQFFKFILFSIIRPLTVGFLQLFADYLLKPFLSIVFNALIQPVLILLYNIATSFRDLCEPIAEAIGLFLREVANVCRAIRIVEINRTIP